ncbi:sulfite exporter TauE/SafE family protein [Ramlibacter sp. AN1015]|uniref:sulfite exporter TauE/SafE family protein n=1 Tax=Ramlibacter sp. AN1015 TaxID=3133428 RepID=UPI0030C2B55F
MSPAEYALLAGAVATAYAVFGMTGFGAAIVAVPVLVQFMPLQLAVPLILLMDLVSTASVGVGNHKLIARGELGRLLPFMLVGIAFGAGVLASADSRWLLVVLGIFVIFIALRSLLSPPVPGSGLHGFWVVPAGTVGGVFSALFGTGGPIYTMYLARRIEEPERFRATISSVVFMSAIVRLVAFAAAGLLLEKQLWLTAAFALPCCLVGLAFGSRLRHRISATARKRVVLLLLTAGGCGVLLRGLA